MRKRIFAIVLLALFVGLPVAVFMFGESRDMRKVCEKKCKPRFARVVPDPNWHAPNTGKPVPLVCECY